MTLKNKSYEKDPSFDAYGGIMFRCSQCSYSIYNITNANNLVYIQNETINDNRVYFGNTIKVGKNVTNKKTPGNVIINYGNVNITGNRVELQSGTKVSKGAVLRIKTP